MAEDAEGGEGARTGTEPGAEPGMEQDASGRGCLSRITRGTLRTLGLIVLLVTLATFGLLRTSAGNATLLQFGLDQLRGRIEGQIEVGAIRSGNLLQGALLTDVRLTTVEGDTLAVADSVEASYSLRELLKGEVGLSGVRVWGGQLHLTRATPAARNTLQRWLGSGSSPGESEAPESAPLSPTEAPPGGGVSLILTDVRLEDFLVRIREPTGLAPGGAVRVDTEGPPQLALDLRIDQALLPRVAIRPESRGGIELRLDEASARLDLLREPIFIESLRAGVQVTDRRLTADISELRTREALADGSVAVLLDPSTEEQVQLSLTLHEFDTGAFQWIADGIPAAQGSTALSGAVLRDGSSDWTFSDADVRMASGEINGNGTLRLRDARPVLERVDLRYEGLLLDELEAWIPENARVGGLIQGSLQADGPLDRIQLSTRTTWVTPEERRITADIQGRLTGLGETNSGAVGFDGLELVLNPLDWGALNEAVPASPLRGAGDLRAELFGTLEQGLRYSAEARHSPLSGGTTSRLVSSGTLITRDSVLQMDVIGDLSPLSFTGISEGWTELPVRGQVSGTVRARGPLSALDMTATLQTDAGRMELEGTLDPRDPSAGFRVTGTVDSLRAATFLPALGEPTMVSGDLDLQGSGGSLSTLQANGRVQLRNSEVRGMPIDSMVLRARADQGRMVVDTLHGRAGGFDLRGVGTLALADSLPSGTLRAEFSTESLMGLRPFFLGDSVLARPESGLDRRALETEGVDPDTLPSLEEVTWDGAASGSVALSGSLTSFELDGYATVSQLRVGTHTVDSLRIQARGTGFPNPETRGDILVEADSLVIFQREFTSARAEGTVGLDQGRLQLELARDSTERYRAVGGFALDSLGGRVDLDSLSLSFDSLTYGLVRPTRMSWTDSALTVDSLEILHAGPEPVRLRASGTLPRVGEADFELDVEGLHIERLARLLQRTDIDAAGRVSLQARITGRAQSPLISGTVQGDSLRWNQLNLQRLEGTLDYENRIAALDVGVWRDEARVLEVRGTAPVDLSLRPGVERFVDDPMNIEVVADALPAATALAVIEDLEDVGGTVSGRFSVGGTFDDPRTSGAVTLTDGAWTIGSLGVRHTDVNAEGSLDEENVITLTARGESGEGSVTAEGTVTLAPLNDPALDLSLVLDNFQAVDRRDVVGVVSGTAQLTDSYQSPNLNGQLTVDAGTIYIDEFVRNASVVDLTSPRYRGLLGDLEVDQDNKLLNIAGNPFMNGLLVDIALDVDRNTWLRGQDLNVEIAGELDIVYDRGDRDFVFHGDLEARRGQYSTLGRTFQVESGTVEFIGTPGLNPILNITATNRVRRPEATDLTVQAALTGTLVEPRLRLSSDESGISESDIISYLLVGQPSSEITSGLTGTSDQAFGGAVSGFANIVTGTITSRLGALAAQQTDFIDYLSITGLGEAAPGSAGNAYLASTQVEIGRYFANGDIFGALVLRAAQLRSQPIGGARLEWQTSEQFHLEAFFEDRFLRVASLGLAELGSGSAYVFGFALVREWGY